MLIRSLYTREFVHLSNSRVNVTNSVALIDGNININEIRKQDGHEDERKHSEIIAKQKNRWKMHLN